MKSSFIFCTVIQIGESNGSHLARWICRAKPSNSSKVVLSKLVAPRNVWYFCAAFRFGGCEMAWKNYCNPPSCQRKIQKQIWQIPFLLMFAFGSFWFVFGVEVFFYYDFLFRPFFVISGGTAEIWQAYNLVGWFRCRRFYIRYCFFFFPSFLWLKLCLQCLHKCPQLNKLGCHFVSVLWWCLQFFFRLSGDRSRRET